MLAEKCYVAAKLHSVHLPICKGAGGSILQPNFQKRGGGGLTGARLLEGGCCERGGDFFQAGLQLSRKK